MYFALVLVTIALLFGASVVSHRCPGKFPGDRGRLALAPCRSVAGKEKLL